MNYAPDCADCPTPDKCKAANDCQVMRSIRHGAWHDLDGLIAELSELNSQCACTLKERDSGHVVGCWKPEFDGVIDKLRTLAKRGKQIAEN